MPGICPSCELAIVSIVFWQKHAILWRLYNLFDDKSINKGPPRLGIWSLEDLLSNPVEAKRCGGLE